jgi:hypothetical protein
MSQAPERMIRAQPHCAILPSSAARNRQGADLAARRPANPITLCDGHGSDFVTVAGQILILMAVHSPQDQAALAIHFP